MEFEQLPFDPFSAMLGPDEPCIRCTHTDDHADPRDGCHTCNAFGGPCDACICCRNKDRKEQCSSAEHSPRPAH